MRTPQPFAIDMTNRLFFNMKDLFDYNPEFFYGCTVKKRLITKKKAIPETEYLYATFFARTKEWNMSDESCKKAQLLITKSWVDKYYFRSDAAVQAIALVAPSPVPSTTIIVPAPSPVHLVQEEQKEDIKQEDSERKEDKEVIENAPPILELSDEEKFHDVDGNIIEIETRGERHEDKIYFKCKHISVGFGMEHLSKNITDKTKGYNRGSDYTFFIRNNSSPNGGANKKTLYLTYEGLLRVLFVSRNKNATIFRKWATMKLFTIQMGTKEAKEILGADILKIKIENYRAVFGKYSQGFPCIYLLSLGKVSELRETFGISAEINGDLTVYKYGFTCDIKRRLGEHNNDYGKLKNINVELELFNYIDLKHTAEAEADIRDIFEAYDNVLGVSGRNELVALNAKQFDRIKKEYVRTGREFAGATKELQDEVSRLKTEIIEMKLKHQLEVQEYKNRAERAEYINDLKEKHYQEIRGLIDKMNR
jgi:prophage antirepressor-like protein